jgi:hypothetical protein
MYLGRFEVGVDGSLHRDQVVVTAKSIQEGAKVGKRHAVTLPTA